MALNVPKKVCQNGVSRTRSRAGAGQELGRNRPGAKQASKQGRSMIRAGAGQEEGRSSSEQSRAEQGRKRARAGQELDRGWECAG